MLPNFFIVGAAKAGTTSLYEYLRGHPDIFMACPKEVNYFSYDDLKGQNLYYDYYKVKHLQKYRRLFAKAVNKPAIGEASVSYLFYQSVPERIKSLIPCAKIIIILRDPVERAFSHYLMDWRLGYVNVDFKKIFLNKNAHKFHNLYYQQYILLGLYYDQVKRYLDVFGNDRVRVFFFEDLKSNTDSLMKSIFDFLHIDPGFTPLSKQWYNTFNVPKSSPIRSLYGNHFIRFIIKKCSPKKLQSIMKENLFIHGQKPRLDDEIVTLLTDYYLDDIKKLEKLLKVDLSAWY